MDGSRMRVNAQSPVDTLLMNVMETGLDPFGLLAGSLDTLYAMNGEDNQALKLQLIRANFRHHFENNEFFRSLCMRVGISPNRIHGFRDIAKIPLLPVSVFKSEQTRDDLCPGGSPVELDMLSAGTLGAPSRVRRDAQTITRAVLGLYGMYRHFFRFSQGTILFLMPPTELMPEMGMVKVLNMLAGLVDGTRTPVRRMSFRPEEALEILLKWDGLHTRHIVGPPFMIHKLVKYLKKHHKILDLDPDSMIITLGGWKRFTGMEIPRQEFNQECLQWLGIAQDRVRDMYGLIEANFLAIECRCHNKHVPPWVHLTVREIDDPAREVAPGRRGMLGILDPTSLSYPAFLLTEDIVYLKEGNTCECGRQGQQVVFLSRVKGAQTGCCAVNIDRKMSERTTPQLQ